MNRGKRILKIIVIIIAILSIVIFTSYINHRIQLAQEETLFAPLGKMVEVNGHQMSIYTEGEGDITLVFMSGGGTCSPILDFKSLYSLLSDDYKIVVVEKLGYGFSDVVDEDRDIETVLSETRMALSQAGIEGPYVLCPHSMSGIESLYWSQRYPDEVQAIVGLDKAVPEAYADYKINMTTIKLGALAATIGALRLMPGVSESDAIKYGTLTEEEKAVYKAVFYRRTATKTMLNEVQEIKTSAQIVAEGGVPDVPILMFSSNGRGTGLDKSSWRSFQNKFMDEVKNGELVELDCSHYVHDIEYKAIAKKTREFLGNITEYKLK